MEQRYSCSFILKHVAFLFLLLRRDSKVLENLSNIVFSRKQLPNNAMNSRYTSHFNALRFLRQIFCLFIYAIKWQKAKSSLLLAEP